MGTIDITTQYLFASTVLILSVGIMSQMLSRFLKMPVIVFLIISGIILGPEVLNLIDPALFGMGLRAIVAFAVVIIVFDGGINIDIRHLRQGSKSIFRLSTLGAVITMIGATLAAHFLVGLDLIYAALFGALAAATGPTVIAPIVRHTRVNERIGKTLEAEGVFNDAVSVILAAVVFELIATPHAGPIGYGIAQLIIKIGIGITIGLLSGTFMKSILNMTMTTPQLARLLTTTLILITFSMAEVIAAESGIMAVAIAALVLGTANIRYKESIREFKGDLTMILLPVIFIILASFIKFDYILGLGMGGIAVVIILMFVVRPIAVAICTYNSNLKLHDKIFVSLIGPRGVVPASMATYFALQIRATNPQASDTILGLIFLTIIITVLFTGFSAGFIARKLKVIPMEILIIGAGGVGRSLAKRLKGRGENVVLVDTDEENCQKAINDGLYAVQGDGGDVTTLKKAGIERARYLVATTDQDNTNLLVCQMAKSKFNFTEDKLLARVNDPHNLAAFRDLGIKSMSPILSASVILDNMIGRPDMFAMCEVGQSGDILEVRAKSKKVIGKTLKELNLPKDSLVMLVKRGSDTIVPHGDLQIHEDDHVTILGKGDAARQAGDMFI